MNENEVLKITIARGEYMEAYAPFQASKEENDEKVKRGILAKMGMEKGQIDMLVDSVEVEFDAGVDGEFDDGPYTPVRLIKKINRDPKPIEGVAYIDSEPLPQKEKADSPRQTMLEQYYGDSKKENDRIKMFDRFKSHIVQKDIDTWSENGEKRRIKVYTVEEYREKDSDADELLLNGYQTRLERLSRAHQKDFSPYDREYKRLMTTSMKEIAEHYEEMHRVNPEEAENFKKEADKAILKFETEDFRKQAIQALIDRDTEFIETNNYTYNSRQNTAENLKTLGKDGEKSVKAQISDEQATLQKAGLKAMNFLIDVRNHTRAPVNKAIGTYVAAPIYRKLMGATQAKSKEPVNVDGYYITSMEDMLLTSQKHSRGMYKNKPSHRYNARKDYYITRAREEMAREISDEKQDGKVPRTTLSKLMKLAVVPRIQAIVGFKEGNKAVLNAGLYDIEKAISERQSQMNTKRHKIKGCTKRIGAYQKEIEELEALQKVVKDPEELRKIESTLDQRKLCKLQLEGRRAEIEKEEIDSVSTDAVSIAQHDKANKANITSVVKGVKLAGKVALSVGISKYMYKEIEKQVKSPDELEFIPGTSKEIEKQVVDVVKEKAPGMDKADVSKIDFEDIYEKGSGLLTYDADGGNMVKDATSHFRGLAFRYDGKICSGSDGKGFDATVLTDVKLNDTITGDTTLTSVVQEIMQSKFNEEFTLEQINDMIVNGRISNLDVWRSVSEEGIPTGWLDASKIVPEIINGGEHEITKEVVKTVKETVTTPGKWIVKAGEIQNITSSELNPVVAAAEVGLAASEISDLNEFMRFTRSQESISRRQPKILELMEKENARVHTEKGKDSEEKGKNAHVKNSTKVEKLRNIKSFQRSNKSKIRYYEHSGDAMRQASKRESEKMEGVTVFEGFFGTKKEDMQSGYDENLLGVNEKEKIEEERY